MKYQITVMSGETEHRSLHEQDIEAVKNGLTILGAPKDEALEHLGILLREGRTVYANEANMSLRVEEAPDGAE